MTNEDNQARERELRERITNLMRSNEHARKRPITAEERQKLKSAASRLDHMLQANADADCQALKGAATRLDQLLADIRKGKDVTAKIKRHRGAQKLPHEIAPASPHNNK